MDIFCSQGYSALGVNQQHINLFIIVTYSQFISLIGHQKWSIDLEMG